jgi:hypothetical protein
MSESQLNRIEMLFASVQTLGRVEHLRKFQPDAFDYIIIDEFHHAAATTYRRLIDHFEPKPRVPMRFGARDPGGAFKSVRVLRGTRSGGLYQHTVEKQAV